MERNNARSKRPRPEWQTSTDQQSDQQLKEENEVIISPHVMRLLKLVQEGSSDHAKTAAEHLKVVTSGSSALVLWEVLGRLQFFLTSPEWRTRHNASLAMEGVAQHVPRQDQVRFLQESHKQVPNSSDLWLTLGDLKGGKMNAVLQNGRRLMAKAETDYDQLEDEELRELDEAEKGSSDFCDRRIQLQRRILASRLGLSDILSRVSGDDLRATVCELIPSNAETQQRNQPNKRKRPQDSMDRSVRALLVMEIKQQENSTNVSHEKSQTILATELIYRMFDQSWYVRHGSLMGILALVRAWSLHQSTDCFGIWLHDILARCLCVMALDRFGDFSGATNAEMSGGTVAPVREMAGQVFSVIFAMTPSLLQREASDILQHHIDEVDWETRHGALIALKYAAVLLQNAHMAQDPWSQEFLKACFSIGIRKLDDCCDDVQSVSARLLSSALFGIDKGCSQSRQRLDIIDVVKPLWRALENASLVSSSVKELVELFSTLVEMNCNLILEELSRGSGKGDSFRQILVRLDSLLACDYLTVKASIIRSTGTIVQTLASFCRTSDGECENCREGMDAAFCQIVKRIYTFYCYSSLEESSDGNTPESKMLANVCQEVWSLLVLASRDILPPDEKEIFQLQSDLVLRYFDLDDLTSQPKEKAYMGRDRSKALSGWRLQIQTNIADAMAGFLMHTGRVSNAQSAADMLELCLLAGLESPVTSDFESACILFYSIFGKWDQEWSCTRRLQRIKSLCERRLRRALESEPVCILVERSKLLRTDSGLVAVLYKAFAGGVETVKSTGASGEEAAAAVVNLWKAALKNLRLHTQIGNVSIDAMRVSVSVVGALVSGGYQCFPEKLTPLVRSLMTSIQNERSAPCQSVACLHMARLIEVLSRPVPSEKETSFKRTCGKIVTNLTALVSVGLEPGSTAASNVIGILIRRIPMEKTDSVLEPVWESISPLRDCGRCGGEVFLVALTMLRAVSIGLEHGSNTTEHVIRTYCKSMSRVGCTSPDSRVRKASFSLAKAFCNVDASLMLRICLPSLVVLMKDNDHDSHRLRACQLVLDIMETSKMAICPFVRSLLPVAMSMMTDPMEECARTAASLFSCLVQVAPVVDEHTSISVDGLGMDKKAELVIDHLIHGQTLPHCDLHPLIAESLTSANIVLRKYQLEGISWLRFLQTMNLNGALCDSMGLGKTLQALVAVGLSHLDTSKSENPMSLIVCPSSVVGHWMGEVDRFFSSKTLFRPLALYGSETQRLKAWSTEMDGCNLVITSYAVLRNDVEKLAKMKWCYCILDEGHLLKNPKTLTARASRQIKAKHKLILTGTPVQNRVFEVWSTFDFLMPNFLGTSSSFSKEFARPITKGQSTGATALEVATSMEKLKLLHQQVLPFILRREKEQVLQELPPKTVTTILCEMSPLQARLYSNFCSCTLAKKSLECLERTIEQSKHPKRGNGDFKLGSDVLKSFLYLRLLCTYPALVNTDAKRWTATQDDSLEFSGKLRALSELLRTAGIQSQTQNIMAADNDSSLIYCDFEDDEGKDEVDDVLCPDSLDSPLLSRDPSKQRPGSKCLIFAQFTRSLDVVESLVLQQTTGRDTGYLRLDGRVPLDQRSNIVDMFNSDDSIRILLLTTRIGGLGLNLTGADTVILLEHDWNPHADLQSIDRAHRIGQKRNVHVYRLVTSGSIEEKIMKLHEVKLAMSEAIVNSDNSTMFSMGTDRLLDIFRFRSEVSEGNGSSRELPSTLDSLVERYEDEYLDLSEKVFLKGFTDTSSKEENDANEL